LGIITTLLRILRFFWDIRRTGFYEINSAFVYPTTNTPLNFRTVIYLDADFYNFIPSFELVAPADRGVHFEEFYQSCYDQHIQKIHTFVDEVNQGTAFWGTALVIPLLIMFNSNFFYDLYLWIVAGSIPDFALEFMTFIQTGTLTKELASLLYNILSVTGVLSLRQWFMAWGVRLLVRIGVWSVKAYRKRKEAKKAKKAP
jgi:hypothetical protein